MSGDRGPLAAAHAMDGQTEGDPTIETMNIAVLGGTGAVGTDVTQILAARNHRVVAVSRHADRGEAATAGLPNATGTVGDLGNPDSVAGVVETDCGARATAIGNGQSHGTAAVTAIAAERLAQPTAPTNPRYLWDLVDPGALRSELAGLGVLTHLTHRGNDR